MTREFLLMAATTPKELMGVVKEDWTLLSVLEFCLLDARFRFRFRLLGESEGAHHEISRTAAANVRVLLEAEIVLLHDGDDRWRGIPVAE
jgi:hypothetical protein